MEIDSSCFKAFQVAAQTLNFTEASRQVGMTQSGVSQHVAKLEKDLESELFLRVGKKVILTDAGISLLNFIESYNDQVLALKDLIQSSSSTLKGKVSYSMPSNCLLSPHFGMLLQEKRKAFPEIELNVSLTPSEEVIQQVLNAEIDFGFVTRKILNEELDYQYFCEEEYVMVSSLENKTPLNDLTKQKWIHYPGADVLFDKWVAHHVGRSKTNSMSIKFSGKTNSLHAAFTMVAHGLGVSIVPRHCIDTSDAKDLIRVHEDKQKKASCKNTIYIVSLKSLSKPMRVKRVIETFMDMKAKS